ncbi:MAG: hypothetical protein DMF94_20910 [Acidobacteria bacterium]|nr:MAG: hypothetical protein DMF94_20910 [Acidobacteriota bacterium]
MTGDVDMWRWTMRIFAVLGAFLIVAALSGATYQWLATRKELAATPPPGHLVDIGAYRLHLWCTGDGAPAVILDTGLGGSSADWGFVQPDVARFTRACSYDRAGMGYSDPGPSPRTARRIASELAELLVRSGIGGPVVLVGASIAGFDVRVFASDHPERAAGLVLVDAFHEDQAHEVPQMARFVPLLSTIGVLRLFGVSFGQRIESLAPAARQFARATSFRPAGYQTAADEIIHIRQSASEVRSSRRKLTIPVLASPVAGEPTRIGDGCNAISLAVRTRMSDDRSRVRSRRVGRPTRGGNESAFRQETDRSGSARSTQPVAALGSGPADRDHRETRRRGSEIFCASPSVTLDARGTSDSRKVGSCHASSPSVGSRATATA